MRSRGIQSEGGFDLPNHHLRPSAETLKIRKKIIVLSAYWQLPTDIILYYTAALGK